MALFIVPSWRYVGRMKDRRQFLQAGVATGLGLTVLGFSEAPDTFSMRAIYQRDLPAVNLAGWQVTALELVYPRGMNAPSTFIRASFLDTFLTAISASSWRVDPKQCCRAAKCSMKHLARSICPPAAQAQQSRRGYSPWHSAKKGRR
jgi:hypothetical protein